MRLHDAPTFILHLMSWLCSVYRSWHGARLAQCVASQGIHHVPLFNSCTAIFNFCSELNSQIMCLFFTSALPFFTYAANPKPLTWPLLRQLQKSKIHWHREVADCNFLAQDEGSPYARPRPKRVLVEETQRRGGSVRDITKTKNRTQFQFR